ncbi:hypothetical protein EDD21DRAFT_376578 [Dissophora ornata]|nr:hypothetical protein EDD21DRAFT_376578 [Dissophora ornata]
MEVEFESRPSRPGSLIWSEDNILALVTPAVLHIFSPTLNGALDPSISQKFSVTSVPALAIAEDSPPWKLVLNVASLRNAVAPQSLDFFLAAWSPTGCSPLKGCMLACITSRHSVIVYIPTTSHVNREWRKYVTLDKYIAQQWGVQREVDLKTADLVESVSLAWSPKISADSIGSLLALGNKLGHITIWHVTDLENIQIVKSWKTSSDNWITQLSWSPWTIQGDHYVSTLAYATADGAVHPCKVRFNLDNPLHGVEANGDITMPRQTLHPCTVLRWSQIGIENGLRPAVLAFSKGNRLHVWKPESNKVLIWRGPIAKPVADIAWDAHGTRIFVFFMDGKHSVLRLHRDELIVDDEYVEFISQHIIARCHMQSKTNITQEDGEAENTNADEDGAEDEGSGGMSGSKLQLHVNSGEHSAVALQLATVYYVNSPFHMEFQRERFQSCTLVLSKTYKESNEEIEETLLTRLDAFIRLPNAVLTRNPKHHLWDLLLLVGENLSTATNQGSGSEFMDKLLAVLDASISKPRSDIQDLAKREALPGRNASLESKLQAAIYSEPASNADRICIYLWNQLQDCSIPADVRELLGHRAVAAEARLREHYLRSILGLFVETSTASPRGQSGGAPDELQECDQTLFLLLCDSILLFHNENKELVALVEKTYGILRKQLQDRCDIKEQMDMLHRVKRGSTTPSDGTFSSGRESCPACNGEIKLENEYNATCANSHSWQRCSVSLLLIADFHPRTCLGCRRKTRMAQDQKPGEIFRPGSKESISWLEMSLRTSCVCCFCGERYFTALRRRATRIADP